MARQLGGSGCVTGSGIALFGLHPILPFLLLLL